MNKAEFAIVVILRTLGIGGLLAIPAVLLPFEWMNEIHQYMGLGVLPDVAITRYLARSLSAFYAMFGSMTLFMSFDIWSYRRLIRLWAFLFLAFGCVILCVDLNAGMPASWTLSEGPPSIVVGIVALRLQRFISDGRPDPPQD